MNSSFNQLFLMNIKLVYRNFTGMFFTLVIPVAMYIILSVLPIDRFMQGSSLSYSQYLLPGMIALTIMQGGIYSLAYWMIDLKSRGVIKRFLVTPISQAELVLSVLASRMLIAIAQVILLSAVGVIFFDAKISINIAPILILTMLGSGIFLLMGLLISMFADSYEAAAPITTVVGLPMTFLGNVFFPVESLPATLQVLGSLLPITYLADGLRTLFLESGSWQAVLADIGILTAWFIGILALSLWQFRLKE